MKQRCRQMFKGIASRTALPASVLACALACASPALASRGHVFKETISKPCGVEPCEGSLKEPDGVAVNEASNEIYVVDKGANRVARFSQSGTYLGEFNGSGLLAGEETEAGAGGRPGESGGSGSLPGERGVPSGRFEEPEAIAIDNSCVQRHLTEAQCKEKDPSAGDVYVMDAGTAHRVIDKYDSEGKYLGQIAAAGSETFRVEPLDGVAVDREGVLWVYRELPVIDGFTYKAQSEFKLTKTVAVTGLGGFAHAGFAVDAQGDFYANHFTSGTAKRIAKLDETGAALNKELEDRESTAVAVEQGSGNALVENLTSVGVFNAEGRELERLGEEGGVKHLSEGAGIAVSDAAETLYVADAAAGQVAVFGPQVPEAPLIEGESIANVSSDSADLGGEVNPRSEAGEAATTYHFEYGACASASTCKESPYEASTPVGQLPADFEVHPLSAHIQGLVANTTYHFRLLAGNSHGQGAPGQERTFTTQGAGGELTLPDNRGWELVSPTSKLGSLIAPVSEEGVVQAAANGQAIAYQTNAPSELGVQGYSNVAPALARRGASSWSARDIGIPHTGATGQSIGLGVEAKFYDAELTGGVVQPFGEFNPGLSEEASESTAFLHELDPSCAGHCYRPLVTGKAPSANVAAGVAFGEEEGCQAKPGQKAERVVCGPEFTGATEDLSHVLLSAGAELKPGAGRGQMYEWAGGQLAQVSLLPEAGGEGKAAPPGASLGLKGLATRGAISADGEQISWEAGGNLYLREMSLRRSVQLDKAEAGCGECESGGGEFQFASADGSRVLFTDQRRLSEDSGAEPAEHRADLYECVIVISGGEPACELSDLTPKRGGEAAEVQEEILGAGKDGADVYFVAKGVLSEAQNERGESALAGEANLYVRHGGVTGFIATLAPGDSHDWHNKGRLANQPTRVSPSGRYLELMSEARLGGYDNRDVQSGKPVAEVYLYDALSKRLECASCEPTGARPVGVEYGQLESGAAGLAGASGQSWPSAALVAANVPGWQTIGAHEARQQPRYLSDEGRLFFNSADALVPQDANGTQDVYEYEPLGIRGPEGNELCSEGMETFSARSGGCVSLISSGSSAQESVFLDASESGDDVFFLTSAKLSPLDSDTARDIYDAHICTGSLPCITASSVQSPPCTTEASCKASPTPQPSIFGAPASASFQGPGNQPPAAPKLKTSAEIRAERLAKALKACRAKKIKKKRVACEKSARKRYGAKVAKQTTHKKKAKPKPKK